MLNDFPRTLSLLRKEKNISQRKAANDFGVSQALLSHYENGMREPGLGFLVKAADYYGVSADYLLGRTMSREGAAIVAEQLPDGESGKDNVLRGSAMAVLARKMLTNSLSVFFDILGRSGNKQVIAECASYLNTAFYKVYRYAYSMGAANPDSAFPVPRQVFSPLCDMQLKRSEAALESAVLEESSPAFSELTIDSVQNNYPQMAPSLFSLLHSVSDGIEGKKK